MSITHHKLPEETVPFNYMLTGFSTICQESKLLGHTDKNTIETKDNEGEAEAMVRKPFKQLIPRDRRSSFTPFSSPRLQAGWTRVLG
jgi:hypothetical protein